MDPGSPSTPPIPCDLCEAAPSTLWCQECRMNFCGEDENNCDADYHRPRKFQHHRRISEVKTQMQREKDRLVEQVTVQTTHLHVARMMADSNLLDKLSRGKLLSSSPSSSSSSSVATTSLQDTFCSGEATTDNEETSEATVHIISCHKPQIKSESKQSSTKLSVFQQFPLPQHFENHPPMISSALKRQEIEGKGNGYVASRPIQTGEILLIELPLIGLRHDECGRKDEPTSSSASGVQNDEKAESATSSDCTTLLNLEMPALVQTLSREPDTFRYLKHPLPLDRVQTRLQGMSNQEYATFRHRILSNCFQIPVHLASYLNLVLSSATGNNANHHNTSSTAPTSSPVSLLNLTSQRSARTEDWIAVFPNICLFNHSCHPNAAMSMDMPFRPSSSSSSAATASASASEYSAVTVGVVYCIEPIDEGQEICITYSLVTKPPALRRNLYRKSWGFECHCQRCITQDDLDEETKGHMKYQRRSDQAPKQDYSHDKFLDFIEPSDQDVFFQSASSSSSADVLRDVGIFGTSTVYGFDNDQKVPSVSTSTLTSFSFVEYCQSGPQNNHKQQTQYEHRIEDMFDGLNPESPDFNKSNFSPFLPDRYAKRILNWFKLADRLHSLHWRKYLMSKYLCGMYDIMGMLANKALLLLEQMEFESVMFPQYHPQRLEAFLSYQRTKEKIKQQSQLNQSNTISQDVKDRQGDQLARLAIKESGISVDMKFFQVLQEQKACIERFTYQYLIDSFG